MRFIAIAVAAAFWFAAGAPAQAHHAKAAEHQKLAQATTVDKKASLFSVKKNEKKKTSAGKGPRKEQYMKAAPNKSQWTKPPRRR